MIVPYVALADGESIHLTRSMNGHLETNIWLTEKILNVKFETLKVNGYYNIVKKCKSLLYNRLKKFAFRE